MSAPSSNESPGARLNRRLAKDAQRLYPYMDDPEYTRGEIRRIYKLKLPHLDAAAAELAPIFGLGEGQLAKERAQGLFKHPAFIKSYIDFTDIYLRGKWELPVGDWDVVHQLVHDHDSHEDWVFNVDAEKEWTVNQFYARFITLALHGINQTTKNTTQMAYWLRQAPLCHQIWVLTHALMFLQLEWMRDYKKHAPVKERIFHFIESFKADTPPRTPPRT